MSRVSPSRPLRVLSGLALCAAVLLPGLADGRSPVPREKERERAKLELPSPMRAAVAYDFADMGATPGGAQDIAFFRDRAAQG